MGGDARTLGGYRLMSQLAVGGMAEIYIAQTNGVGGFEKLVALKVIHPNFSQDPEFVQMLVDEAKLAVQLQHANIVQTFDLGRVDEQYYIAMELIDGIDLYKLLRQASEKDIDFPFEIAAFIAGEACNGLDYAHRKRDPKGRPLQIVHRDISPQNLLVSYDGEVKIVDFGIAKAALRGRQTAAGVIKGKYYYMSPEQAWGDPIDARTDVFSTGILLYEMLVGQMLYLEEDLEVLLDRVRKAVIPLPSTKRTGIPQELEKIVMKALAKRPADRWQTAGEMAAALTQFLHTSAPNFNRAKLASFAQDVLGQAFDDPTTQSRDARTSTALNREMLAKDENSLLFQLSDLKPPEPKAPSPRPLPKPVARPAPKSLSPQPPRGRDQATSPVSLPEAIRRVQEETGDFEESDQTVVDGGSATLMAHYPGDSAPQPLDDDPARDQSGAFDSSDEDEDEATLTGSPSAFLAPKGGGEGRGGSENIARMRQAPTTPSHDDDDRPLPGVKPQLQPSAASRKPALPAKKPPVPATRPLGRPSARPTAPDAPSLAGDDDEERTSQHKKPTQRPTIELRKRPAEAANGNAHASPSVITIPVPVQNEDSEPTPVHDFATARPPQPPEPSLDSAETPLKMTAPPDLPQLSSFEEPTRVPPEPGSKPLKTLSGDAWPFQPIGGPNEDPTVTPPTIPAGHWTPYPPVKGQENSSTALVRKPTRTMLIVGVAAAVLITAIGIGIGVSGTVPARASIEVVSLPNGAEVHLDGNPIAGKTPLTIRDVDAQTSHHVRVSLRNYDVWESDVKFEQGAREVRLPAVLVPTVGTLVLVSQPAGAEAIVNGRIRGITPVTVGDLPPNDDVTIELRLRGYKVAHKSLGWDKQRRLEVTIPLEKAK